MTAPEMEEAWPQLFRAGARAMVENARRLGLTWRLIPGTVTADTSTDGLEVRLDGDTESITVVSMIGSHAIGTRVYVINVPPAGNYAIGWVTGDFPRYPGQRIATNVQTTSSAAFTTTETVVQTVVAPLVAGLTYSIEFYGSFVSTANGDDIDVRIREDNVTGTGLQRQRLDLISTAINEMVYMYAEYTAVATGDKTFVVTGDRIVGTGNITRNSASVIPTYLWVEYVGG